MHYPDEIAPDFSDRKVARELHPLLARRWSPRSFKQYTISEEDVDTLLEAARVAPSCYNEQPWRFYLSNPQNFSDCLSLLVPANRRWAKSASLIGFIASKIAFSRNNERNDYAAFDCGAAWMSLTVQARSMGLYTHGMGGIDHQQVAKYFGIDDAYQVICGFVIGVADSPEALPDELREKDKPSPRKSLSEIISSR
ncbi:nitroreductase [Exilibacterium tricleocarpae]|uniref:Nitroreductase n=1 Tax=Exilibacterium tricleocarpae TaxID=2591008 RepID=A0A545SMX2_9GAMM|nr:nitroreductase family protein [Exilibacterium tricleocarpae]TQV66307.1 nitroreductase [Exilibacterium tricleocarpae]